MSGVLERTVKVEIEETYMRRITAFVSRIIEKKSGEHHIIDDRKEQKRFTTGFYGEAALE